MATTMLERNNLNRPIIDQHVKRIARAITEGRWRFNGDSIKIAANNDILDGQHRLWAIIDANQSVETVIVYGIERDAFATIDTIRKLRSASDTVALNGVTHHRQFIAAALQWLIRWQSGKLPRYRAPENYIENSAIEEAIGLHPFIGSAVDRAVRLRGIANPSIMAFLYYVLTNRDAAIAERMMNTLEDPSGIGVNDPFFRLRSYFIDYRARRDPLVTIALAIKAANAAHAGRSIQLLNWRNQGKHAEDFPTLAF